MGWGRVREYGIAFAIIVGGVLGRLALDQVIPDRLPFITFFSDGGACCLTLLVCTLAGIYWIDAPAGENAWAYQAIGGAVFALTAGMIVYLVEELQRERRLSQAHGEQSLLINRELTHRISNLFAILHPKPYGEGTLASIARSITHDARRSGGVPACAT